MFVLRMYHAFGDHSSTRMNSIFVLIPCIKVCPTTAIASWHQSIHPKRIRTVSSCIIWKQRVTEQVLRPLGDALQHDEINNATED